MLNNLGTRLFKSVTDRAGDLGDKFEEQFERLSNNLTVEVDIFITEAVSLSNYCKVALIFLIVLLILLIARLCAFGIRVLINEGRSWFYSSDNDDDDDESCDECEPKVILLMPDENGRYHIRSDVYNDEQTKKQILDKLGAKELTDQHLFTKKVLPMLPPRKDVEADNNNLNTK